MRKTILFAVCFLGVSPWVAASAAPVLNLVWPPEGHHYWALHSSFIFGSVQPSSASVTVNGQPVSVYKTGAFLVMVPLSRGEFPIQLEAVSDGAQTKLVRQVVVDPAAEPSPYGVGELDTAYYSPREDILLKPGDWLRVVCKGPPGAKASFKIGTGKYQPMGEVDPAPPFIPNGVYKGDYWVPFKTIDHASIRFRLATPHHTITGKAPGFLSVRDGGPRRVCQIKDDLVTVLTGPDKGLGYQAFLPKGVVCGVTGSWGRFLRLGFGSRWLGWVDTQQVALLPPGTPVPHSILGSLTVKTVEGGTEISIPLEAQQPFRVEQTLSPVRFKLSLYGVTAEMNKVHYGSDDSCVKEIRWKQVDESLCELDILTNQKFGWGYNVRYEGNRMIFEIRHAPVLPASKKPLAGLIVALDAGHSSADPGATGPLGTREDAINLLVAHQLETKLKTLGAAVVMVRQNDETLDLFKRTRIAWAARAHLFISLHENSIADSGNPLEDNGFSIHYWIPQSRPLAEAVHEAYRSRMPLKDRGLWCDNLAVCRITEMPSILTESAYIIVPEQEEMLLDPVFRDKIAGAIAQGIRAFLKRALS